MSRRGDQRLLYRLWCTRPSGLAANVGPHLAVLRCDLRVDLRLLHPVWVEGYSVYPLGGRPFRAGNHRAASVHASGVAGTVGLQAVEQQRVACDRTQLVIVLLPSTLPLTAKLHGPKGRRVAFQMSGRNRPQAPKRKLTPCRSMLLSCCQGTEIPPERCTFFGLCSDMSLSALRKGAAAFPPPDPFRVLQAEEQASQLHGDPESVELRWPVTSEAGQEEVANGAYMRKGSLATLQFVGAQVQQNGSDSWAVVVQAVVCELTHSKVRAWGKGSEAVPLCLPLIRPFAARGDAELQSPLPLILDHRVQFHALGSCFHIVCATS